MSASVLAHATCCYNTPPIENQCEPYNSLVFGAAGDPSNAAVPTLNSRAYDEGNNCSAGAASMLCLTKCLKLAEAVQPHTRLRHTWQHYLVHAILCWSIQVVPTMPQTLQNFCNLFGRLLQTLTSAECDHLLTTATCTDSPVTAGSQHRLPCGFPLLLWRNNRWLCRVWQRSGRECAGVDWAAPVADQPGRNVCGATCGGIMPGDLRISHLMLCVQVLCCCVLACQLLSLVSLAGMWWMLHVVA
jgi:hypothetical protein